MDVHYPYNKSPDGYNAIIQSLDNNGELVDATQSQSHSGWQTAADQATTIQSKIIQVGCKPQLVKYWLTPIESIGEPAFVIEGLHFSPSEVLIVVKSRER